MTTIIVASPWASWSGVALITFGMYNISYLGHVATKTRDESETTLVKNKLCSCINIIHILISELLTSPSLNIYTTTSIFGIRKVAGKTKVKKRQLKQLSHVLFHLNDRATRSESPDRIFELAWFISHLWFTMRYIPCDSLGSARIIYKAHLTTIARFLPISPPPHHLVYYHSNSHFGRARQVQGDGGANALLHLI